MNLSSITSPAAAAAAPSPDRAAIAAGVADIVGNTKLRIHVKLDPDFDVSVTGQFGPKDGYATLAGAMNAATRYNYNTAHDLGSAVAQVSGRYVMLHTDDTLRRPWGKIDLPYYAFRTQDDRIIAAIDANGELLSREVPK